MRYFGGKHRIAKTIIPILESLRKPNQVYLEPFVGAANVILGMSGERIGSDAHPDLVMLLEAVKNDTFTFPEQVSEEEYSAIKSASPSALRAFIGFGCSFAGKWFGGYAREDGRDFCKNARGGLLKKRKRMTGIEFVCKDYRNWRPEDMLIYCDPPYVATTKIHNESFDHTEFWSTMRKWSERNTVIISEYTAPEDFVCIKEIPTKTDMVGKAGKYDRIERLFQFKTLVS